MGRRRRGPPAGRFGGWIYWQEKRNSDAAEQIGELHAVLTDIASGRKQDIPQRVDSSGEVAQRCVRASAMLTDAALALEQNNRSAAIAKYRELVDDKGLPQVYRDVGDDPPDRAGIRHAQAGAGHRPAASRWPRPAIPGSEARAK